MSPSFLTCLRAIPTWFLTCLLEPFLPASHPWKGKYYSLSEWARGQTSMCKEFDWVFWIGGVTILAFLRVLL